MRIRRTSGRVGGVVIQSALVLWMVSPSIPPAEPAVEVYDGRATVTIVGRDGTFGHEFGLKRVSLPSGQGLGQLGVPGWSFPAARKPGAAVLAVDGSLLMPAVSHNDSLTVPTSPEMAVAAYDPRANTSEVVELASTPGVVSAARLPVAATVTGLAPLPDGAVAFTGWTEGIETAPVFGLLTKVDGHWRSEPVNRWTAHALGISRARGLARLPASGDLIIAQEGGVLTALKVTGPDMAGRYSATVRGEFHHPADVTMREVHADPTGRQGAERFVVALERPESLPVIQEFTYDHATGRPTVLSAALLPGDQYRWSKKPYGYRIGVYDHKGNLWAARQEGPSGGSLAVYTSARCKPDRSPWGRACRPDYDIIQASQLRAPIGLVEDPATGTMVLMTVGGNLMSVRAKASGSGLDFEIGNLVDIGAKLLTVGESSTVDIHPGAVDRDGHLWFPSSLASHDARGGSTTMHWLFAVNLAALFDPPPIRLPHVPGRQITIQAENTGTIATRKTKGTTAAVDVHSRAFFTECFKVFEPGCTQDGTAGDGFYLLDEWGFGHREGELIYRVDVPVAGRYRLAYQVGTFEPTKNARIELAVADHRYVTPVSTNGDWRPMRSDVMVWFDAGTQTITLSPPRDGGGWFLNSMTLQRV